MFNWFKKKDKIENPIEITVSGINPQTDNEFLFYNFVEIEYTPHLEKWYEKIKSLGHTFKPEYEKAIQQKINTREFKNPFNFPEYFNNKFDFIAIDFETANNNRVSACALGLVFIKNDLVVYQTKFYIKPPKTEKFLSSHIDIHKINPEDVEDSLTFDELWECELVKYFNNNLIVFHNASMDLSVLKNLFKYYNIKEFEINYIDTMRLAEKTGNPRSLEKLAEKFNIIIEKHHDPEYDAKACAFIYSELVEIYPNYTELIGKLNYGQEENEIKRKKVNSEIKNENLDYIQTYSITNEQVKLIEISGKGFIFTGEIITERHKAKKIITENGGIIKSGITINVDYVIIGTDFGWAKIQKVHELNTTKGCEIKILTNSDFEVLKKKYAT